MPSEYSGLDRVGRTSGERFSRANYEKESASFSQEPHPPEERGCGIILFRLLAVMVTAIFMSSSATPRSIELSPKGAAVCDR